MPRFFGFPGRRAKRQRHCIQALGRGGNSQPKEPNQCTDRHGINRGAKEKVGKGEFVLFKEAGRIKVARGVNSLTTVSDTVTTDVQSKGDLFQKIKTVDIMDLIANDIRATARDAYIGKLSNSFDNKVLLMSAIHGYFDGLINDGLVEKNTVEVDIDMEEQKKYLKSKGVNLATMSDREIREANTGDQVFIAVKCKILDAIESISIRVFI